MIDIENKIKYIRTQCRLNPDIFDYVNYWNSKKEIKYLTFDKKKSIIYNMSMYKDIHYQTIKKLILFKNNKLFKNFNNIYDSDTKFDFNDFETSVDNYYLALTSNDHMPLDKSNLKVYLHQFLRNDFASQNKSLFLIYLNPPEKIIKSKDPILLSKIKRIYSQEFLGKQSWDYSPLEGKAFKKLINKFEELEKDTPVIKNRGVYDSLYSYIKYLSSCRRQELKEVNWVKSWNPFVLSSNNLISLWISEMHFND